MSLLYPIMGYYCIKPKIKPWTNGVFPNIVGWPCFETELKIDVTNVNCDLIIEMMY